METVESKLRNNTNLSESFIESYKDCLPIELLENKIVFGKWGGYQFTEAETGKRYYTNLGIRGVDFYDQIYFISYNDIDDMVTPVPYETVVTINKIKNKEFTSEQLVDIEKYEKIVNKRKVKEFTIYEEEDLNAYKDIIDFIKNKYETTGDIHYITLEKQGDKICSINMNFKK